MEIDRGELATRIKESHFYTADPEEARAKGCFGYAGADKFEAELDPIDHEAWERHFRKMKDKMHTEIFKIFLEPDASTGTSCPPTGDIMSDYPTSDQSDDRRAMLQNLAALRYQVNNDYNDLSKRLREAEKKIEDLEKKLQVPSFIPVPYPYPYYHPYPYYYPQWTWSISGTSTTTISGGSDGGK